jgi:hypothetical protein
VARGIWSCTGVAALLLVAAAGAANPVSLPNVKSALVAAGYPARTQCGEKIVPYPILYTGSHVIVGRLVPNCWVVVERDGYSLHVDQFATAALAKLAYERGHNRWARNKRAAAIGSFGLSAYRLPAGEWMRITKLVASAVASSHP